MTWHDSLSEWLDLSHRQLERHIANGQGELGPDIIWVPECGSDEIEHTVIPARCFVIAAALALNEMGPVDAMSDNLSEHYEIYVALLASKTRAEAW